MRCHSVLAISRLLRTAFGGYGLDITIPLRQLEDKGCIAA